MTVRERDVVVHSVEAGSVVAQASTALENASFAVIFTTALSAGTSMDDLFEAYGPTSVLSTQTITILNSSYGACAGW